MWGGSYANVIPNRYDAALEAVVVAFRGTVLPIQYPMDQEENERPSRGGGWVGTVTAETPRRCDMVLYTSKARLCSCV